MALLFFGVNAALPRCRHPRWSRPLRPDFTGDALLLKKQVATFEKQQVRLFQGRNLIGPWARWRAVKRQRCPELASSEIAQEDQKRAPWQPVSGVSIGFEGGGKYPWVFPRSKNRMIIEIDPCLNAVGPTSLDVSQVVPYDSPWPAQAKEETTRLPAALGHQVREIVRIGNTAVPWIGRQADHRPASLHRKAVVDAVADAYSGSARMRGPPRSWRARTPILPARQPPVTANLPHRLNRDLEESAGPVVSGT
jgi:hypothetical protein